MQVGAGGEAGRVLIAHRHRQDAPPVLAGGLGDELLRPVAESRQPGAAVGKHDLVVAGQRVPAERGAQFQARVAVI